MAGAAPEKTLSGEDSRDGVDPRSGEGLLCTAAVKVASAQARAPCADRLRHHLGTTTPAAAVEGAAQPQLARHRSGVGRGPHVPKRRRLAALQPSRASAQAKAAAAAKEAPSGRALPHHHEFGRTSP
eukprot:6208018-Pleurochrysis_carterae.AAC.4